MSESKKPTQADFFGVITASVSHEINNVLATVKELSGLLDDLALLSEKKGGAFNMDQLKRSTKKIEEQVGRGQKQVKRLNMFAHSIEHVSGAFSANEALERIVALSQRFAKLKKVTLKCELPDPAVSVEGSLFDFQHLVFRCIELAFGRIEPGADLTIRLLEREGLVSVVFSAERVRVVVESDSDSAGARSLAEALGGSVVFEENAQTLRLMIPARMRQES